MSEYIVCPYCFNPLSTAMTAAVVRCRDCVKWSFFDTEDGIRFGECSEFTAKVDEGAGHATREDGFCAWGERKVVE